MKCLSKILIALFLLGFGATIEGQNAITASGNNASGSGGTVSYSVGQVVYSTNTDANGSVVQGVQQPFEISIVSAIVDDKSISLELSVFPNPVTDYIRLKIETQEVKDLRYHLYDIKGNILLDKKIDSNFTNISMQNFLPATYLLKITQGKQELTTFKIIKH